LEIGGNLGTLRIGEFIIGAGSKADGTAFRHQAHGSSERQASGEARKARR
jgi:hypothetical protein